MIEQQTLGQRIRSFRKRAKKSQLEFEYELGMSAGSLSRIENDEVNPTKETMQKIAQSLNLTFKEITYLNGLQSKPATAEEVDLAIKEVENYFSRKGVLAYLIDDRWRFLYVSDSFQKLLNFTNEGKSKLIGKSLINIMLDENLGITRFLDSKEYENMLYYQFSRFYQEVGFMEKDPLYIDAFESIKQNPRALEIWKEIQEKKHYLSMHTLNESVVTMQVLGVKVKFFIVREFMHKYPRFDVIEFVPKNKLVKMLSSLL